MSDKRSTGPDKTTARAHAVALVEAGEPLADVALRFNIPTARLAKWAGVDDSESAGRSVTARPDRGSSATILDIAEHAGLSKSVVSRALRGQYGVSADAKQRVEDAVRELGYVSNAAAQNLSSHRTNTIGVLVRDASAPFYGEMQSAIQKRGSAERQRVFITSGALDNDDEIRALEDLIALRVDGLIVSSGRLPLEQVKRFSRRFPVVVAGRPDVDAEISSVFGDEDAGARELAEHLAEAGHRRVGVLQPSATISPVLHRRTSVMASALVASGVEVTGIPVAESSDAGRVMTDDATLGRGVTACMTPNDRYAAALLTATAAQGRELAITGFDGLGGLASELIGLTTWQQPIEAIGTQAVEMLLDRISGAASAIEHRMIPGRIILSRSA